jgi:hypothetical protein
MMENIVVLDDGMRLFKTVSDDLAESTLQPPRRLAWRRPTTLG